MNLFAYTAIVLGMGVCDQSADWCGEPVGEVVATQNIAEFGRNNEINFSFKHLSEADNGQDQGVNVWLLEYRKEWRW